jgi:hypothetical protein
MYLMYAKHATLTKLLVLDDSHLDFQHVKLELSCAQLWSTVHTQAHLAVFWQLTLMIALCSDVTHRTRVCPMIQSVPDADRTGRISGEL